MRAHALRLMTVAIAAVLLLGAVGQVAAAESGSRYVLAVTGMT